MRWILRFLAVSAVLGASLEVRAQAAPPPPPPPPPPPAAEQAPSADSSQPAPASDAEADSAKRAEAKERFLRGLELAKAGNWDAALAEFLASRELHPTRAALLNAGLSLRELERYTEAREIYLELLERFGTTMPAEERAQVETTLGELAAFIAEVDVVSEPPGAKVVIDGEQRGTTPLTAPLMVNAGTHSIRVSKEGFESFEAQLTIAGKQRKNLSAKLKALSRVGTLVVREASGQVLDVVVDGAVVGQTPFTGQLEPGVHSLFLSGAGNFGTPPSSANVRENSSTTLVLRAEKLDSELRVEPVPSNASVFIDGVMVGNGVWQGKLKSGAHRVEITAPGHVPYRGEVTTRAGQREDTKLSLDRDLSSPMWQAGFVPHLYVEAVGGLIWSPSLGGDASSACSEDVLDDAGASVSGCSEHSQPLGFLVGARGGYTLTRSLGIELFLGYLYVKESMVRAIRADAEGQSENLFSEDYQDSTSIGGPAAAVSASYRFLEKTPLTVRLWAGVTRATVKTANDGRFVGSIPGETVDQRVSIPEEDQNVWIPFGGPEVRIGYRFSDRFSADIGVAGLLLLAGDAPRTGETLDTGRRASTLRNAAGAPIGVMELPREDALGTSFAIAPSLGLRVDF